MEENPRVTEALRQVIESEQLDKLSEFEHSIVWEGLRKHEKSALGSLFYRRGKRQYEFDDAGAVRSLKIAVELLVDIPDAWLLLSKATMKFYSNLEELEEGLKAGFRAYELDPASFDTALQMALILSELGVVAQALDFLGDADNLFNKIYLTYGDQHKLDCSFYWHWGLNSHFLGKLSGEPSDYRKALNIYRLGVNLGETDYRFYRDYGLAFLELGMLLNKVEFFEEAVPILRKALELDHESPEVWQALARTQHILFDFSGSVTYGEEAIHAYARADRLSPLDGTFLLRWSDLLLQLGRHQENADLIEASFAMFERIKPEDPLYARALRAWAEAELYFSDIKNGSLQYLHKAEEHVKKSVQLAPEDPYTWLIYGTCKNELGRYFAEDRYYFEAIEKFRTGITFQENHPLLWHGLALSHFIVGEMRGDIHMLKKAAAYCSRAVEFDGERYFQLWNDWAIVLLKIGEQTKDAKVLLAAKEKFEKTLTLFQKKQDFSKINPNTLNHYGSCLDLLGEIDGDLAFHELAVEVLWQAILIDPGSADIRYNYAFALIHLADAASDLDMYGYAIEQFRHLTEQDPEDDMAWHDWGSTLLRMADLAEDPAMPGHPDLFRKEAKEKLLIAAGLGYAPSYYTLACLHALMDDAATAVSYLKRAEEAESLPALDDLLNDLWLENVKDSIEFRLFIDRYML